MSRADVLAQARLETAGAPSRVVTYTDCELAERAAMRDLAVLARRWRARAALAAVARSLEDSAPRLRRLERPFPLVRRIARPHPLVKFVKTLQGIQHRVVQVNESRNR